MDELERDLVPVVLGKHQPPCLSLYQPTHRHQPSRQQDPIRFRNLVDQLEATLRKAHGTSDVHRMLAPFRALTDDPAFWGRTLDGLAILSADKLFKVYRLQRPVPELAVVADSFHVKPLLRIVQSGDRYQILGLGRGAFRLFEGNRDTLDEIDLAPEVAASLADESEREDSPDRSTRVYGGGGSGMVTRHGTDRKSEVITNETMRFFRSVDENILVHHSRPSGLPLVLAALPENQTLFREISDNPFLVEEAIPLNPDSMSLDQLRERAWEIMLPRYLQRLNGFIDRFRTAHGTGLATDNLEKAAEAATERRVEVALIDAERRIPLTPVLAGGSDDGGRQQQVTAEDALDDVAEEVLRGGGEVVIVPPDQMPTKTGLAAILRF